METGDLIVAIVKEFATEMIGNMAIYCLDLIISMKGPNYYIEMLENKKLKPLCILKDRDAVKFLIFKRGELRYNGFHIELRHGKHKNSILFARDSFDLTRDSFPLSTNHQRYNATLNEYLKVLESEIPIVTE
jgi:hypothetical protein